MAEKDLKGKFVVRLYDYFDNQWVDISKPLTEEEAILLWCERTDNGKHSAQYEHKDYYMIFPADTHMLFSDGFGEI